MNHRPFEDWIFSEEPLSPVERADLEAHLQACAACQKLSTNWQEVSGALHTAPMLSPAPGFSSRWQERLATDRTRHQRRLTVLMLVANLGGAWLLFLLLGVTLFPLVVSPTPVVLAGAYRLAAFVASLELALDFVVTFLGTLLGVLPASLWVAVCVMVGALFALWIITFERLSSRRRVLV